MMGTNWANQHNTIHRSDDIWICCLDLRLAPLQATQRTRATYSTTR